MFPMRGSFHANVTRQSRQYLFVLPHSADKCRKWCPAALFRIALCLWPSAHQRVYELTAGLILFMGIARIARATTTGIETCEFRFAQNTQLTLCCVLQLCEHVLLSVYAATVNCAVHEMWWICILHQCVNSWMGSGQHRCNYITLQLTTGLPIDRTTQQCRVNRTLGVCHSGGDHKWSNAWRANQLKCKSVGEESVRIPDILMDSLYQENNGTYNNK